MIGIFWTIDIVLAILGAAVMADVFVFYLRRYSELRSRLTIGLVVFSGALFAQSVISTYIYYVLAQTYTSAVAIPLMIIMILELLGLISLIYTVNQ